MCPTRLSIFDVMLEGNWFRVIGRLFRDVSNLVQGNETWAYIYVDPGFTVTIETLILMSSVVTYSRSWRKTHSKLFLPRTC